MGGLFYLEQQDPIRESAHLYTTLKSGVNVLPSDVLKT